MNRAFVVKFSSNPQTVTKGIHYNLLNIRPIKILQRTKLVRDIILKHFCYVIFSQIVNSKHCMVLKLVHRCGACGSMRACHAADPGSIPGRDRFPG